MRTKATNLSLSNDTKAKAAALRERRQYKSVTALVEELIRDEFERRFPNGLPPAAPPVSSDPSRTGHTSQKGVLFPAHLAAPLETPPAPPSKPAPRRHRGV